jgi:hypothetical protein
MPGINHHGIDLAIRYKSDWVFPQCNNILGKWSGIYFTKRRSDTEDNF